jgi:acyl carrier protein
MGLDAVHLLMTIEQEFDIVMHDDDYAALRTVDDLYQCVCARLAEEHEAFEQYQQNAACPSISPFLKTRRVLTAMIGVEHRQVRPSSELRRLIPWWKRRGAWSGLQSTMSISLPALILPKPLFVAACSLGVCAIAHSVIAPIQIWGLTGWLLAVPAIGVICWRLQTITRPFAFAFPPGCTTVADIILRARRARDSPLRTIPVTTNDEEVWNKLVRIISEVLYVDPSEVTPEARFVEDLGLE